MLAGHFAREKPRDVHMFPTKNSEITAEFIHHSVSNSEAIAVIGEKGREDQKIRMLRSNSGQIFILGQVVYKQGLPGSFFGAVSSSYSTRRAFRSGNSMSDSYTQPSVFSPVRKRLEQHEQEARNGRKGSWVFDCFARSRQRSSSSAPSRDSFAIVVPHLESFSLISQAPHLPYLRTRRTWVRVLRY